MNVNKQFIQCTVEHKEKSLAQTYMCTKHIAAVIEIDKCIFLLLCFDNQ